MATQIIAVEFDQVEGIEENTIIVVPYRINRQLSVWILPPLMIRAFGAHCQHRTHAVQQTQLEHDRAWNR